MIREDEMLISHNPYAVDLSSMHVEETEWTSCTYAITVNAVWFRRRRGLTVACIGTLKDYQKSEPQSAVQFLARHNDGRYGGNCLGRWDGIGYWGAENLQIVKTHLDILRPMLEGYPAAPPGYDGWWRF